MALRQNPPDVLLLDVEMPGLTGIDVLDRLPAHARPVTVFVTAYPQYALPAYERAAIGYLLKPYDRERLSDCLARARRQVIGRDAEKWPDASARSPYLTRLAIPGARGATAFVDIADVLAFRSEGNYVSVYLPGARHLMRGTLSRLATRLDPAAFARTHRSCIANLSAVTRVVPESHGDFVLHLRGGLEAPGSRTYREEVLSRLRAISGEG